VGDHVVVLLELLLQVGGQVVVRGAAVGEVGVAAQALAGRWDLVRAEQGQACPARVERRVVVEEVVTLVGEGGC
jgi:hypothetical protein